MHTVIDELFFVVRTNPYPSGTSAIFGIYENINRANDNILNFNKAPETSGLYVVAPMASTSGVIGQTFFTLPLQGDDANTKSLTVNNLPVARYQKSVDLETSWNLLSPLGGSSGLEMRFSWFPNASQSGAGIKFKLTVTQLSSGVDTSTASSINQELSLTDDWIEDRLYIHNIEVNSSIGSLENFGIKFQRLGSDPFDDFLDHTYLVDHAVRFNQ